MREAFFIDLWESAKRLHGFLLALLSLVVGVIAWLAAPALAVPLWLAFLATLLLITGLVIMTDVALQSSRKVTRPLPKVLMARSDQRGRMPVCLLEPSPLFSNGTVVSFYIVEEETFESLLGIGVVVNVQDDGKIQVQLTRTADGTEPTIDRLAANDIGLLQRLKVKPTMPSMFLVERE